MQRLLRNSTRTKRRAGSLPGFDDVYLSRLAEIKDSHIKYIVEGSAKDLEDYRRICGFLQGIATAERDFKELSAVDED